MTRVKFIAEDGAEIAETAMVLPLLFMIIFAIFWFGRAFFIYSTITRAANAGAHAAALPGCATCAAGITPGQNAYNQIQTSLAAAHMDIAAAQPPVTTPNLLNCQTSQPVACDASPTNICVQENVNILPHGTVGGSGSICGVAVSFAYPFPFRLPFTSLGNIVIPAGAQVRMEAQ
jgi:Flp pilus assembly protein TadG